MGESNTHLKEWCLKPSLEQLRFHWDPGFPIAGNNWLLPSLPGKQSSALAALSNPTQHEWHPASTPLQVCSTRPHPTPSKKRKPTRNPPHSPSPHAFRILGLLRAELFAYCLSQLLQQTQTFPTFMDKALNLDLLVPHLAESLARVLLASEIASCPRLGSFLR